MEKSEQRQKHDLKYTERVRTLSPPREKHDKTHRGALEKEIA